MKKNGNIFLLLWAGEWKVFTAVLFRAFICSILQPQQPAHHISLINRGADRSSDHLTHTHTHRLKNKCIVKHIICLKPSCWENFYGFIWKTCIRWDVNLCQGCSRWPHLASKLSDVKWHQSVPERTRRFAKWLTGQTASRAAKNHCSPPTTLPAFYSPSAESVHYCY